MFLYFFIAERLWFRFVCQIFKKQALALLKFMIYARQLRTV